MSSAEIMALKRCSSLNVVDCAILNTAATCPVDCPALSLRSVIGWLVGCFGFNGPLRQYFSLYRAVSQREGERGEKG